MSDLKAILETPLSEDEVRILCEERWQDIKLLLADREALVRYVRAFREEALDRFPLLASYGLSYSRGDALEAYEALSQELKDEINDSG